MIAFALFIKNIEVILLDLVKRRDDVVKEGNTMNSVYNKHPAGFLLISRTL
jgi:hypothetical protein